MSNPWYVITGGPCAGKTTLVNALAAKGFRTVSESARSYIEAKLAEGKKLEEIRADEVAFQRALIPLKVAVEKDLPQDETVFFDRGMHDSATYLAVVGVNEDPELERAIANTSYRKVFLLDLFPFKRDNARTENAESAKEIHELLAKTYESANIEVVRVPNMSTEKRIKFVLSHL